MASTFSLPKASTVHLDIPSWEIKNIIYSINPGSRVQSRIRPILAD